MSERISRAFLRGRHIAALALVGAAFAATGLLGLREAVLYRAATADLARVEAIHADVGEVLRALSASAHLPAATSADLQGLLARALARMAEGPAALREAARIACAGPDAGQPCAAGDETIAAAALEFAGFRLLAADLAAEAATGTLREDVRLSALYALAHNALLPRIEPLETALAARNAARWSRLVRTAVASGATLALTLLAALWALLQPMERRILDTQAALTRETARAQEAERSKGAFLANMAHEIRTALNGVIGVSELLSRTPLGREQADYVAIQRASGESLLRIINDVLDYSKLGAGEMTVESAPFDARRALVETARLYAPAAAAKGLTLDLFVDPALPRRVAGDGVRLRQALANLVQNAVKFTAAGRIDLDARWRAERRALVVTVRDTGVGIPADKLGDIFAAFRQVDNALTPKHHGTGLGLAISRMLAERMGGSLTVESAEGVGTAFRLAVSLGPAPAPAEPARLAARRVLLALGPGPRRDAAAATLAAAGATLVEDGAPTPDAVVFDATDGRSAAARLREIAPSARLVALVEPGGAAEGADTTAPLPLDPEALVEALAPARAAPVVAATKAMAGLRVLVADDNPVNQMIARRMLEELGCAVEVAADGAEAVAAAIARPPDLVLMDVSMPVMTGLEAAGEIRRREAGGPRRTPIVALTAHAMLEHRARCVEAGMDDHLAKPFRLKELRGVLRRWGRPEAAAVA